MRLVLNIDVYKRQTLASAEIAIAEQIADAARIYENNPVALQIRQMGLIYDMNKDRGVTILVPTDMANALGASIALNVNNPDLPKPRPTTVFSPAAEMCIRDRHSIRVVARWGQHVEQLEEIPLTWADNGFGQGVSGTAIRENRVAAIHNIARDPRLGLFRKYPALSLFGSCIAIPLRTANGSVLGVFTLYNTVRAEGETAGQLSFDHKEKELLTELARDIVNGINLMRIRTERNEALKKQQASDARFADLLASSPAVLFALEHQRQGWRCVEMTPNLSLIHI